MSNIIKTKDDFKYYQGLMNQKFNWEDQIRKDRHEIWKRKNSILHCIKQHSRVEDQLRLALNRKKLEFKEEER